MTDTREATLRRLMKLVTDGAGLQTNIYAESPEGMILMATAVNYDVAEYMARAANHFEEAVEVLRWYASSEAWTVRETEGPDGDYGKRARALISKLEASHGSA
ncbi:hypothetical protein CHELA1G11_11173 [Hyphomicrobiales bacterium]|nr:hypothetical protein CHELA1G11_11173 [Hyphomicrobiales bacterium]CAH1669617.1 hypothetical protein CHELA1G2_13136 [Hyphomicrobiales bacterium]